MIARSARKGATLGKSDETRKRERESRGARTSPEKCTQCTTREAAKRDHAVGGARKGGSKKI